MKNGAPQISSISFTFVTFSNSTIPPTPLRVSSNLYVFPPYQLNHLSLSWPWFLFYWNIKSLNFLPFHHNYICPQHCPPQRKRQARYSDVSSIIDSLKGLAPSGPIYLPRLSIYEFPLHSSLLPVNKLMLLLLKNILLEAIPPSFHQTLRIPSFSSQAHHVQFPPPPSHLQSTPQHG